MEDIEDSNPQRRIPRDVSLLDMMQIIGDRNSNLPNTDAPDKLPLVVNDDPELKEIEDSAVVSPKETYLQQLPVAHTAYAGLVDAINSSRQPSKQLDIVGIDQFKFEYDNWFSDEIEEQYVAYKELWAEVEFTLVAAPATLLPAEEIINLVKSFSQDQPYKRPGVQESYLRSFTPRELSGFCLSEQKLKFFLIPHKHTPTLNRDVIKQRNSLINLRANMPGLRSPSILETISYWYALREKYGSLEGEGTMDLTMVRNFGLPKSQRNGSYRVPISYIYDDGKVYIKESLFDEHNISRALLGESISYVDFDIC